MRSVRNCRVSGSGFAATVGWMAGRPSKSTFPPRRDWSGGRNDVTDALVHHACPACSPFGVTGPFRLSASPTSFPLGPQEVKRALRASRAVESWRKRGRRREQCIRAYALGPTYRAYCYLAAHHGKTGMLLPTTHRFPSLALLGSEPTSWFTVVYTRVSCR